jgi:hypothetical protein
MEAGSFKIGGTLQDTIVPQGQIPEVVPPEQPEGLLAPKEPETPQEPITAQEPVVTPPAPAVEPETPPQPETPPAPVVAAVIEQPVTVPKLEPAVVKFDDPELQEFYDFKQNNKGSGMTDYLESKKDWNEVTDLQVLMSKIKQDNKSVALTDAQLVSLVEKNLDVDLSEGIDSLDESELLSLKLEAGRERSRLQEEQQKYSTPKDGNTTTANTIEAAPDTVTLTNGHVMSKTEYEQSRNLYKNSIKETVDSTATETFSFEIGTGDEKKTVNLDYVVEQQDRQSLLSELDNVPMATINQYVDDSGNLDVTGLSRAQLMRNEARSQKVVSRLLSLAYAQGQEEILKQETNVNFDTTKPPLPVQQKKPIVSNRDDVVTVNMHGF